MTAENFQQSCYWCNTDCNIVRSHMAGDAP